MITSDYWGGRGVTKIFYKNTYNKCQGLALEARSYITKI